MIKARKGNALVFGLSENNIQRLKQDQPIKFNLRELGLPELDIFIMYGTTEEEIQKDFLKHGIIGVNTEVIGKSKK